MPPDTCNPAPAARCLAPEVQHPSLDPTARRLSANVHPRRQPPGTRRGSTSTRCPRPAPRYPMPPKKMPSTMTAAVMPTNT